MIDLHVALTARDKTRIFNLDVALTSPAKSIALFGASGAGKTFTLETIAGLRRPQRGHIIVDGRVWFDSAQGIDLPAAQRRVGYLFQGYALFPHLTVRQNVGFGLSPWYRGPHANERARVDGMLEQFGLSALAESRPASLSGGQQQRVALARALVCEPHMLLLDEPFAALNALLRQQMREELAAFRRQWRIPMLMITHEIDDLPALADEVAFIVDGRLAKLVSIADQDATAARHLILDVARALDLHA
jgi:molybdate transport system ATP-binding protein